MRDVVSTTNDIPTHQGIEIQVELLADDIDDAVAEAGKTAEAITTFLTAAARAPAAPIIAILAYEITPDVEERQFIQWTALPDMMTGKTPISIQAFGLLFKQMLESTNEKLVARLRLSMDWHRTALQETEPLFRFIRLWLSCETLEQRLSERFNVDTQGFQGLRRLAEENGYESEDISEMLGLRRDLFHRFSERPAVLRPQASRLVPIMEQLLVAAWALLLGQADVAKGFPTAAVMPYPMRYEVRGTILQKDMSAWGVGNHPHLTYQMESSRAPSSEPGKVTVTYTPKLTLQNAQSARLTSHKLVGPAGPNVVKVEGSSLELTEHDAPDRETEDSTTSPSSS